MRKKILAIIALIVLLTTLALSMTACNGNVYESRLKRAGYQSIERDQGLAYLFTNEDGSKEMFDFIWRIKGTKSDGDKYYSVTIYRFENTAHAIRMEKYFETHPTMLTRAIYRMDDLFFSANSKEALRDVLYIVDITITEKK